MSKLSKQVKELKSLLDLRGVSDSGREYKVYTISSAHVLENRLEALLKEMFEEVEND